MAWVSSVQPEYTVPLGAWNFRNFKPEFLLNGKSPGCHSNFPFNDAKKNHWTLFVEYFSDINRIVLLVECMLPCIPPRKHINSCSFNVMYSHFWKPFVLPVHAKTMDLPFHSRSKLLQNYYEIIEENTDLSAKPSSWPHAKVLFYYSLTKSFILGSTLKLLVNSNLPFLSCFYDQWRLSLRIMALIGLRCIPSLWCAVRHRCHTCWSHRDTLQCQTRS